MRRLLVAVVLLAGLLFWWSVSPAGTTELPAGPKPAVAHVVILGDSVAHGAGDERRLGIAGPLRERGAEVVNLGVDGARTGGLRALLGEERARAAVRAADVVVLSIGGDDCTAIRAPSSSRASRRTFSSSAPWPASSASSRPCASSTPPRASTSSASTTRIVTRHSAPG